MKTIQSDESNFKSEIMFETKNYKIRNQMQLKVTKIESIFSFLSHRQKRGY